MNQNLFKRLNSTYENLEIKDFEEDLSSFRHYFQDFLLPSAKKENSFANTIDEIDFLLSQYYLIYSELLTSKQNQEMFQNDTDKRNYYSGVLFSVKMIFHDIIIIRNLVIIKYESQLKSVLRNLIEKSRILVLILYDREFAKEFLFNDSNLSEKERYFKLLKPSKIFKRIENNYNNLDQKRNEALKNEPLSLVMAKEMYHLFSDNSIQLAYDDFSKYIHYNDFETIFYHHAEKNRINMSLYQNSSPYFEELFNFIIIRISKIAYLLTNYFFLSNIAQNSNHRMRFITFYSFNTMIHFN
ncbi:hypothetical protein [Leptospira meyeri]|uniref:hypothetical protein n=1 Tax=Leptospira meyeri TaxID=29508 RepID=UPI00223E1E6B|nr:hypothetical protein [Leptospira meyeri]MCW7490921.1 hypothetical protein [Leptospira meyeri]